MKLPATTRRLLSLLAVAAAAWTAAFALSGTAFVDTMERKTWDWRVRHLHVETPPGPSVLVLIDEATLRWFKDQYQLRWPLPRDSYCNVVQFLHHAGARAVVFDIQFAEPDVEFDDALAECLKENPPVVLAWQCQGEVAGDPPWTLSNLGQVLAAPESCRPVPPMPRLAAAVQNGGRVDESPDPDGVLRTVTPLTPVLGHADRLMATLGVAALALEHTPVVVDNVLQVGDVRLPLLPDGKLLVRWQSPDRAVPRVSFKSVFAAGQLLADGQPPQLDTAQFKDKVVVVAASAAATFELRVTPAHEADLGAHVHASVIDALSTGAGAWRWPPLWILLASVILALLTAGVTVLPTRLWLQLGGSAAILCLWLLLCAWQFTSRAVWVDVVMPALTILVASALGTVLNYAVEGRARARIRHAFTHYLAPEYVEVLVQDPSRLRLGGERREITAFFSDIQGFTTISEKLDPAALVALLNECLSAMTEIILSEGGIIDKYIGDAIVAIFGAPLDQPDHAERAMRASLRCQAKLVELRQSWAARGLPELRMRIGLNSGTAVVGNMGSQQRFDYTMMGDMVNLASRLESAASVYALYILVGEETIRRAGDKVLVRELDRLRVKGKKLPVVVGSPLAMTAEATADQRDLHQAFAAALESHRACDFTSAIERFQAILVRWPNDGPSAVMLARAQAFAIHPPQRSEGEAWDGVHILESK